VACSPQAWSAAAPLSLIQSCLGLQIDAESGQVKLKDPLLPDFLNDLILTRIPIRGKRIDMALERMGGTVVARRLNDKEDIEVLIAC
jgi:glycogen debranching enzyme